MAFISESLLYVSFAILAGAMLLRLVPEQHKPALVVPHWLLIGSATAIPVLSFVPIHLLNVSYATSFELTYWEMMKSLLLDVKAGTAWTWTLLSSIGLLFLLSVRSFRNDRHMPKVALFIVLLLIIWLGYASHASSLSSMKGLIVHTLHFLPVTLWLGTLFIVGMFARDSQNWEAWLRWFSPFAVGCAMLALIAGFTLMTFTTPQYLNGWMLPYGQAMLIKHLLIVPLLLLAYTNGFRYKSMLMRNPSFKPGRWLRAEAAVAALVLAATGYMGQQAPPHDVKVTLGTVPPSPLFTSLFKGSFGPDTTLQLHWSMESILMLIAAGLMAYGIRSAYRIDRPYIALASGLLSAVFGYFGLMFAMS
ncbi:copper resistance D family protein [Paenibacillus chungangensis]|uniref:Copper resistance D family protein n=1 Tax=Paenibacillus chungangensis TaxID=696535 RepID=A0ABW3HXT1_9BACL